MSSFRLDEREKAKQFAGFFKQIEDRLSSLERSNQLNFASIEGGSLDIYDEEGTLKGSVGVQADGAVALVPDPENTEPPPTPSAPTVESALAGLAISWDGRWDDAEAPPTDFSLIQVHVGTSDTFTPDASTQLATITDVTGGTATVHIEGYDPVWVRLVAANTAALTGEPSTAVQGQARQAVGQDLIDGIVSDVKLAEGAVTAAKIALEAVTTDKLKPGAVTDLILADDAVTAAKLAASAVDATALADGAVLAEKLHDNAVTLGKIAQNAVTELALADSAVTKAKVAAAAIDSTKLADLAVTAQKLGQGAVTAGKIASQAVNINALTAALQDTTSQRYVDAMGDSTAWTVTQSGTGATWSHLTGVTDAPTGQTVGQASGFIRVRGNTLIPYDPDVLYRLALRVRATAQPTTPDVVYFGAIGFGADGTTLVNRDGANSANSQYYIGAVAKTVATADGWVNIIGFLKGRAAAGASGSAGPNNDPRTPGVVHANVRFIAPYVWLNYNNQSSVAGTMQVDAVTVEALKTGVVDSVNLVAGSVTTAAIATDAITATHIAAGAVNTSELAANAVTTAKLAANAVTANEIAAYTITAGQLAVDAVTAASIKAGEVTTNALAAYAVAAGKIAANAITATEINANAVTAAKIQAGAVTANAIAAGAVTTDKLTVVGGSNVLPDPSFEGAGGAAIAAKQTWLSIDTAFGNGSPSSLKIDATSATAAYRSAELTLLPVTPGDQLYVATDYYPSTTWVGTEINLQVRWEKADGTVLSYGKLSTTTPAKGAWARFSGTVTAPANAVLGRVRVESGNATAGSVWWDNAEVRPVVPGVQIADGAITTPKMVAGSIQGDRIATNSLDADRIVAGSITTSKLNVTTAASLVQKLYDAGADAGRWKVGGTSVSTAAAAANLTSVTVPDSQSGGYVMRAVGGVTSAWRPDILIPYDPNVLYRVSGVVRQTVAGSNTANQRFYMGVQGVAADGVTCVSTTGAAATSNAHYVAAAGVNLTAGAGWTRFVGYLKGYAASGASGTSVASPSPTAPGVLHANARYISPLFFANYSGGTGTAEIDMLTVEVVETGAVQTVNIADGAITTPTMTANTINGDRITGNTLNADKIVGKSITAAQIQGLSITAAELAADSVTATKIKAGEIDATHIKVGAITADRLDANAINGKTITGSTLQTAASGARVVLDTELAAYGSGSQAIVIQPDYTNITQTSPSPRLYFTSDDGTNLAFLQVVGAGDTANFFTYSGAFTDPADSSVYRWRTSLGQDAWITERVAEKWTGRYTSGYPKISLTKAQASIYAPDIYAAGVFHANNIASGRVTITPSAANTPTSTTVTGLGLSGANPRGIATASTTVPGTSVTGVAVTDLSTSSATVWVTRANTISTVVDYLVIAS